MKRGESVRQAHGSGGFITQVDADAEEISGAGGLTALAADAILGARGGGNLARFIKVWLLH